MLGIKKVILQMEIMSAVYGNQTYDRHEDVREEGRKKLKGCGRGGHVKYVPNKNSANKLILIIFESEGKQNSTTIPKKKKTVRKLWHLLP